MGGPSEAPADRGLPPVALPWRLPNAPATFRGRFEARRRLVTALQRGPLVRLWGPPGMGRTGLALHALHRDFARRVPRTLYISLARAADARAGIGLIFRALQDGGGQGALEWAPLLRDPVAAAGLLIDVVDEADLWVVLDDLDAPASAEWLLPLVATYARRARWLAIGEQAPPAGTPPGQAVQVGPLSDDELRALALDWGHRAGPALERSVQAAAGSPRALDVALHGPRPVRLTALLTGDARERRLLGALAAVPDGLELSLLDRLDALPDEARCRALVERGLVMRQGDTLRLAAGPEVESTLRLARSAALDGRLLALLEADPDPARCMQALTLAAEMADRATMSRLLDARGDDLLAEGYALQVSDLLAHETAAELRRWRWRAECVLGRIDVVDGRLIDDEWRPRSVRYALNALGLTARWSALIEMADRCLERWAAVPEQAEWVAHVRVARGWALVQLGRYAEARAALEAFGPIAAPRIQTMALALEAHLLAVAGEVEPALAIGRQMWRTLATLPERARKRRMYVTAHLFYQLQRYAEAEAVVRAVIGDADWALLPVQCDRHVLVLLAGLYGQRGRLIEAERYARRAENVLGDNPSVRTSLVCIRGRAAIERGALHGWDETLRRLAAESGAVERSDLRVAVHTTLLLLQIAGGPQPGEGLPPVVSTAEPRIDSTHRAVRTLRALRRGEALERPAEPGSGAEAVAWWSVVRATARMLRGESGEEILRDARDPLRARGMGSLLLAVQQALCDALLLAGRRTALAEEAALLAEAAVESPRYRAEARFFEACAADDAPDWRAIAEMRGACAAGRRARALLGDDGPLDALDRRIVDALGDGRAGETVIGVAGVDPGPPWRLCGQQGRVYGPGGELDLSRSRVLRGLMQALAEAGGARGKEALVQAVWDVADYHPLKHDNRLRVAVRKLRGLLAEQAGLDDVLLTLEDGYGLRGPCGWRPAGG